MSSQYLSAADIGEIMDCSASHGYTIIKQLNTELKAKGYITRSGRVPRKYFYERTGLSEQGEANAKP